MTNWLPQIDDSICTGCRACVDACPKSALGIVAGKAALLSPQHCDYCAVCEDKCPSRAISLPYLICFQAPVAKKEHL